MESNDKLKLMKDPFIWNNTKIAFTNILNILRCSSCHSESEDILYIIKCCKDLLCLKCEKRIEICSKCHVEKSTVKLNDIDTTLKMCSDLSRLLRIKSNAKADNIYSKIVNHDEKENNEINLRSEESRCSSPQIPPPLPILNESPIIINNDKTMVSKLTDNNQERNLPLIKNNNSEIRTPNNLEVKTPLTTARKKKEQPKSVKRKLNSSFPVIDTYLNRSTTPNVEISNVKKIKTEMEDNLCKTPKNINKLNISNLNSSVEKSSTKKLKRNMKGETALHLACIKGDYETAKKLLNEGFDPNVKDYANWTSLHEACNHGHKEIVELLLQHSAFVDSPGCENYTPLHDAVEQNQIECVKLLLKFGADVNKRTSQGLTTLQLAGNDEMKDVLMNSTALIMTSSSNDLLLPVCKSETPKPLKQSPPHRLTITCSGFHSDKKSWISSTAQKLGWTFKEEFDENVTHLIPLTNEKRLCIRTMKYMSSLLLGKWIVSIDWLDACSRSDGWIDEDEYEINGCVIHPDPSILFRARNNVKLQLPKLFEGGNFHLSPKLMPSVKNDLTLLIKYGSGQILNRDPKSKISDFYSSEENIDNNDSDQLNQSALNQSFKTTTLYNADPTSPFSYCCYYIVVQSLDDLDNDDSNKSSKNGKNVKNGKNAKNKKDAGKNILYKFINKKVCNVTPAWVFDCVSTFSIS